MKFPLFIALALLGPRILTAQTPTPSLTQDSAAKMVVPATVKPSLSKGSHFDELRVGDQIHRNVTVREVTVRSILISDTDGIASIPLRELPIELQHAFGYQPALEAASNNRIAIATKKSEFSQHTQHRDEAAKTRGYPTGKFGTVSYFLAQNTPPQIEPEVDLRSRFQEFGLTIKDQGRRPSCVVFAVVSALEFENAEVTEKSERLSEDYLIWATCQTLKRAPQLISPRQVAENDDEDDHDMGFSFRSVLTSLQVFGVATEAEMPDTFLHYGKISAPSAGLIRDASARRKLIFHYIPGETNTARLRNIIQFLNQGIPVPIGVFWPSNRSIRNGFLDTQRPHDNDGHAITLIGYKSPTENLQETEYIFRNSYGPRWGDDGYGRVTYKYLVANLQFAVALEVQNETSEPPKPSSSVSRASVWIGR